MSGSVSLTALASYATVAAAAYTIYNQAGSSKSGAAPAIAPAVAPATKLPLPEDTGRAAEKASLVEMMQRRGRASTILTDTNTDTLGA